MNVRIEDMPDLRVACIHAPGPYATAAPQAWQELSAWMGYNQMLSVETLFVGILDGTPEGLASESMGYDAGVSVPQHIEGDGCVTVRLISGGPCATFIHKGSHNTLAEAWSSLYWEWLPASGRTTREAPCFEVYLNAPSTTPDHELLTRLHLPLSPL